MIIVSQGKTDVFNFDNLTSIGLYQEADYISICAHSNTEGAGNIIALYRDPKRANNAMNNFTLTLMDERIDGHARMYIFPADEEEA